MKDKNENIIKEEKKDKKKKKKIIIIAIVIIVVIIGVVLAYISDQSQRLLKPIIYIYPKEEINVSVKLGKPENLTCTYPTYENSWEVKAKPNGDLTDIKTEKNFYALYWEGKKESDKTMNEGFIVEGKDTIKFLEEKLEILGLNQREANEFIVYWLPKMQNNKYNYIRFASNEKIDEDMPIEITPKPETIIRVMMEYRPLKEKIKVTEQQLFKKTRKGYTVVEWGGTKIN